MARARSLVGFVPTLLVSFACSAPPGAEENDGSSIPEYIGALPGNGTGNQPQGNTGNPGFSSGATPLANPPSSEAVGNGGSVPIDNTANSAPSMGSSGSPADQGAMSPPALGAGGSVMTPPANGGVAGSSMEPGGNDPEGVDPGGSDPEQGQGGSGSVPGNGVPPGNPPSTNSPPSGSGCGAGIIFCEGFEGIALGPITAPVNGMRPDRTVNVIEEPGRGRVLQVIAGTGYNNKSGVYLDEFSPPNNSHFGRAYIRVQQFPAAGGDHWVLVEATLNESGERVRPVGGQFQRWAPGSAGPSGDWTDWTESDAVATAGVYECVEWQVNGANGANDVALWVNGTEVIPLDHANFNLPAFNLLWLGWVVYQTGQPPMHDVRFDDVVISSQRVGCN